MKKYFTIIAALVLVLTLFSCGQKNVIGDNDTASGNTGTSLSTDIANTTDSDKQSNKEMGTESAAGTETSGRMETELQTDAEISDDDTPEVKTAVVINEICAKNKGCHLAPDGEAYDWIELYNRSSEKVNLKGYSISDKKTEPDKYTFGDVVIKSGEYLVVYAVGEGVQKDGMVCLPFSLSKDGENVILTSPDKITDTIKYPAIGADESYGRADDGDVLSFLSVTAGKTNKGAEKIVKVAAPVFSHESGFYGDDFWLDMSSEKGTTIYFSTDGSTPGFDSDEYSKSIRIENATKKKNFFSTIPGTAQDEFIPKENLDKVNVIRAVAIDKKGNVSAETHATYILLSKEQLNMYKGVAIASIYTDSSYFFDYNNGIYALGIDYDNYMNFNFDPNKIACMRPANYTRSGSESERPVALEFFDIDGTCGISQSVGLRISGCASRAWRQKSFKIYARGEYGKGEFDYPIFEGATDYDSFIIRSGGSEWSRTKMRDILAQELVSDKNVVISQWKPCAVFFNGEYWGIYMLMQRYDEHFFAEKYGVEKDNVVLYKNSKIQAGEENDKTLFNDLKNFAKKNDLTKAANYEKFCSMIDIQSYIDYVCMNICINNTDWPANNTAFWRTRKVEEGNPYADTKWRCVCFDADLSMGNSAPVDGNTYNKLMEKGYFFKYVYKNPDFAKQFRETLEKMLKTNFAINKVDSRLEYYEGLLSKQMVLNFKRYKTASDFPKELSQIHTFWEKRAEYVIKYTDEIFGKK